jgi:hypothetical protein
MKPNNLKPIKIGYGDDKVIFYLRMISLAEEEDYNAKFNDITDSDTEKYQKTFDILKEALAEFSTQIPDKLEKVKGEFVKLPLIEKAESPLQAINEYFGQRTIENERVIRGAYNVFKSQLYPESSFL